MALSSTAGLPVGYEQQDPPQQHIPRVGQGGGGNAAGMSSMSAASQLFARLAQEIEEKQPKNCIHFMVDFLCKHYPEHLHGFASIWHMDPDLERERHEVINFFKAHKISTAVAAHFTNAGYDTLDTLTTLTPDSLVDVEAFNNVKWLPGHKVRLQQIFAEIPARVRAYRQQYAEASKVPSPRHHHTSPHHPHHGHHGHHSAHQGHHASPHQPVAHRSAGVASVAHHQAAASASPYAAAALGAHAATPAGLPAATAAAAYAQQAALLGQAAALMNGPSTAASAAGFGGALPLFGQGVAPPALPAQGNLFQQYSPYPAA